MFLQDEQLTAAVPAAGRRRPWKRILLAIGLLALAAALSAGSFFLGQSTRKSAAEVAALRSDAVAAETDRQQALRRDALAALEARDRAELRRVVKKMKRAAKRRAEKSFAAGQSAGYSSGQSVGFSSGKKKGEEEGYAAGSIDGYMDGSSDGFDSGMTAGSDELTCSDDPDVSWLPPCF